MALVCGSIIVSGWFAGVLDDPPERVFWAGAILAGLTVAVFAPAAFPGGRDDEREITRMRWTIRIGLVLAVVSPALCIAALVADFYLCEIRRRATPRSKSGAIYPDHDERRARDRPRHRRRRAPARPHHRRCRVDHGGKGRDGPRRRAATRANGSAASIVAYGTAMKREILGVSADEDHLARDAPARWLRALCALTGADLVVSTTGVGGPDPEEGKPPGTVIICAGTADGLQTFDHAFDGTPEQVVQLATVQALRHLRDAALAHEATPREDLAAASRTRARERRALRRLPLRAWR